MWKTGAVLWATLLALSWAAPAGAGLPVKAARPAGAAQQVKPATAATLATPGTPATPARIIIGKLHLDTTVGLTLDRGPAFYPGSGRPGQPYTIAIAGHRTTHTHPFWSLDALRQGDRITLLWKGQRHNYVVTSSRVVSPNDWSIASERGYQRLILTTCTPRFSARQRLVVFAKPSD